MTIPLRTTVVTDKSEPPPGRDDTPLLRACLRGERRAQAELYRRYYAMVRGVCVRYAEQETEVDDWVNRTYLKAFGALDRFDGRGPFGAWLRRIAVTTCIDELRNLRVLRRYESSTELPLEGTPVAPAALERLAMSDLIALIQRLPPTPRTVFNLHVVEAYSHAEIGQRLGLSEANSRYFLRRARLLLQSYLNHQKP